MAGPGLIVCDGSSNFWVEQFFVSCLFMLALFTLTDNRNSKRLLE